MLNSSKIISDQSSSPLLQLNKGALVMSIWITSIVLLIELCVVIFCLSSIAFGFSPWLTGDLQIVAICVLFGGLGGCIYCLRGIYLNACVHKRWDADWLPWYFIRPIVSLVLGGISYLFIKSGLLLLGASQESGASQLGIWAVAFLAGLNVDNFLAKIESVGQTVLGVHPSRQSKSSEQQISQKDTE
jgi:hypothetical protein